MPPRSAITHDTATEIAVSALGFLGGDAERLARFLDMTGLEPAGIRAAARSPAFLPAVLDHLMADESLLLAFAAEESLPPERVAEARAVLGKSL